MQLSQTRTTIFFITRTARLRARLRRIDPYTAGSLLLIALIIAGGLVREAWPTPAAPAPTAIVFATPVLASRGQHSVVRPLARAPIAGRMVPTAMPTAAPAPVGEPAQADAPAQQLQIDSAPAATPAGYIAHTTAGDVFVPNDATPVPNDGSYTGPFLAPAQTCTGFGDWRDTDPMYAASPACHTPAPAVGPGVTP